MGPEYSRPYSSTLLTERIYSGVILDSVWGTRYDAFVKRAGAQDE